jgi:hypothetical protein
MKVRNEAEPNNAAKGLTRSCNAGAKQSSTFPATSLSLLRIPPDFFVLS